MSYCPVLFTAFITLLFLHHQTGPCEDAKAGATRSTLFVKDSIFNAALNNIKNAFQSDLKEHAVTFGKDAGNNIISSEITNGTATGGTVPVVINAFADLHNHPNNAPPDAGDLYGLLDINKNNAAYNTRFVVIPAGTIYALLITSPASAAGFNINYPRQIPAFPGGPPGLPVNIVDEFREMKYKYNCTDEMAMAFILEKYNAGVSLLKQDSKGTFRKLRTIVSGNENHLIFTADNCP